MPFKIKDNSGVWRTVVDGYNVSEAVARRVLKGWYLGNGTKQLFYEAVTDIPIGELTIGTSVFMNVNGIRTEFIIVQQGLPSANYDASCDGTWLLMKNIYVNMAFDSSNHDYANSDIHSYLNNTFVNLFDSDIKSTIKQVKIPYRARSGSSTTVTSGSSGLSAKVFLLSYTEVGFSGSSYAPVEGAVLGYFNGAADSKRVAKLNGTATFWWLRSPGTNYTVNAWGVVSDGSGYYSGVTGSYGVRPAIVLPSTQCVDENFNVVT